MGKEKKTLNREEPRETQRHHKNFTKQNQR